MIDQDDLEKRRQSFQEVTAEIVPVLADTMEILGRDDAADVGQFPSRFLDTFTLFLMNQDVANEDQLFWVTQRVAYFVGQLFVIEYEGEWFLNEVAGHPYYGRIMVGRFRTIGQPTSAFDPFATGHEFASLPPGRDLRDLIASVHEDLVNA